MTSPASPDKPYHHGALREAALAEGVKLLTETGVAKFSLREVARRLGVTATALYHHFPDKEDLLFALAHEGLERFQAALTQVVSAGGGLADMGAAYVRFFLERPYYMDLLFRPVTKFDDRVRDIWGNTFELVEAALQARGIGGEDAAYYAVWLWSSVHGLAGMLRDGIVGNPEACGPDAPPVFHLNPEQLLGKILPLVARTIGPLSTPVKN